MKSIDLLVPDLGDFKDVPVIDVLVKPGDRVRVEDPLITLETEKASMDVPATAAGTVERVFVKKGDKVSRGSAIVRVTVEDLEGTTVVASSAHESEQPYVDTVTLEEPKAPQAVKAPPASKASPATKAPPASKAPAPKAKADAPPAAPPAAKQPPEGSAPARETPRVEPGPDRAQLVVLGAGPGGYTAAFRAADLGMKVTLIERSPTLGGVCLNVGCIPSKALLHAARVIEDAHAMEACGIAFGAPRIDHAKLRAWKDKVVSRLTNGLTSLAKQRKVDVVHGTARFLDAHRLEVSSGGRRSVVAFDQCIIAAGSEPAMLPGLPADARIMDSSAALEVSKEVRRLLVVGGGIIGLEMACVYDALGTRVSVVELTDQLIPGCDPDLLKPLLRRIQKRYEQILTGTRVTTIEALSNGLRVSFSGAKPIEPHLYDRVLIAVGRSPNGKRIDAAAAGVKVDDRGFIPVDRQMRTSVPHIFAIGDVNGAPMLAHKASHEGKTAAEVAAGLKSSFDARVIPSVAYTDPEIAWVGHTEASAREQGIDVGRGVFPWVASGRALSMNREEGTTKLLFDKATHRIVGAGIVGANAGDLISEVALAIEMGCDAADIGLTIHPHPTLSETVAFAADAFEGTLTDLYMPRK